MLQSVFSFRMCFLENLLSVNLDYALLAAVGSLSVAVFRDLFGLLGAVASGGAGNGHAAEGAPFLREFHAGRFFSAFKLGAIRPDQSVGRTGGNRHRG